MQESEFRDWARRQYGSLEERVRVLEARPQGNGGRREADGVVRGNMEHLARRLLEEIRAGEVAGLAIAYLTPEGGVMTGWSEGSLGAHALSGAAARLGLEMLVGLVAGAAEGETDEGTPGARVVVGPAPAGESVA